MINVYITSVPMRGATYYGFWSPDLNLYDGWKSRMSIQESLSEALMTASARVYYEIRDNSKRKEDVQFLTMDQGLIDMVYRKGSPKGFMTPECQEPAELIREIFEAAEPDTGVKFKMRFVGRNDPELERIDELSSRIIKKLG